MGIQLDPRRWSRRLAFSVAVVSALGLGAELALAFRAPIPPAWIGLLSLSYEANVPTWYSAALLLGCAVLFGLLALGSAAARPAETRYWWLLAMLATYGSLDESVQLHESLNDWIDLSGIGAWLYFSWVVPAAAAVGLVGLVCLRFLLALPRRTRRGLVLAASIYLTGALVLELPLGWWTVRYGDDTLGYALIDWVEESLEMVGLALALRTLAAAVLAAPEGVQISRLEDSGSTGARRSGRQRQKTRRRAA